MTEEENTGTNKIVSIKIEAKSKRCLNNIVNALERAGYKLHSKNRINKKKWEVFFECPPEYAQTLLRVTNE